jgi:hypothetical protein
MGQKTGREKFEHVFCLKDFVEINNMETSDIGIHQCIKDHLTNLQSRISKYFPEAVSGKYIRMTDQFHARSFQNNKSSLHRRELY